MNTPISDFLEQYRASGRSRLHMPGHKGIDRLGFESLDITEVAGADELYHPDGIIAESEANARELFNTHLTLYSTEGSSHAIRSMIILAYQNYYHGEGRPMILAARNAHKAFLYALALCDCDVEWLYPSEDAANSVAACLSTPQALEEALNNSDSAKPFAVYITSPDYLGQQADIRGFSDVCKRHRLPLLVDNAHGSYLHFLDVPQHPIDLGADMCCDSAHKTLPVITGGAYLHIADTSISMSEAKSVMEYTGTTSPSYLILASLDRCNAYLADTARSVLQECIDRLDMLKDDLRSHHVPVLNSERTKLVIDASAMGFDGTELGDLLRSYYVEPEFCDAAYLVCMFTPDNAEIDYSRVYDALIAAVSQQRDPRTTPSLRLHPLSRMMTIRDAIFAKHAFVTIRDAVGKVCGAPTVSCPPAIPIAVSGECFDKATLPILQSYGIDRVSVVID